VATLYTSTFTRPHTLSRIDPALLRNFLNRFEDFLLNRGVQLDDDLDLSLIGRILMEPGPDTPRELIDALFAIKAMSVPSALAAVDEEARRLGIPVAGEITQAEIALRLWMTDPEALLEKHAELTMLRVRSFQYFSAMDEEEVTYPTDQTLQSMERALDIFFNSKGHGRGTQVHVYPRGHEMWFLIRRGDRFRREATLDNGESGSIGFRPEKCDVVVFNQLTNEIGINAPTEAIQYEYRKQFGFYLFGRDNYFAGASKYSLEPLRELGEEALNVIDVPGIQWIKLTELQASVMRFDEELITRKARDLFATFRYDNFRIPADWRLKRATFKVRFDDNPTARSVTVKQPNVARYTRDSDATLVEEWLMRRGFIEEGQIDGSNQNEFRFSVP
jgi:hypothetical protein